MHYNFLFNGCSFTEGAELEGSDKDLEHQRTHRFSHLVGQHYNKTYDNISKCGKSNDWIVEKTINWFEEGNTCDLAVIQLTRAKRTIVYNDKNEPIDIIQPILTNCNTSNAVFYKNFIKLKLITNNYFKYVYSEYYGQQNFYKNLFFINEYLKSKKINVIYLILDQLEYENMVNSGWKMYCNDIKVKSIVGDLLPKQRQDKSKKYYCQDFNNKYKYTDNHFNGTHPNEFGHQKIAEYIINEIDKNAYIL